MFEEYVFVKKTMFFSEKKIRTLSKTFSASCWMLFGGYQHYNLCVNRTIWWKTVIFEVFFTNTDKEQKFFALLSKIFRQGFQNCILRLQRNFLRRPIFLLKILFFSILHLERNNSGAFVNKIQWGCRNCNLRVHRNILMEIVFLEKKLLHFWALDEKFRLFLESFWRVRQNCLLRVQSNNLSKNTILRRKNM